MIRLITQEQQLINKWWDFLWFHFRNQGTQFFNKPNVKRQDLFKKVQNVSSETYLFAVVGGIFNSRSTAVNATASSVSITVLHKEFITSVQYSCPVIDSPSIVTLLCFDSSENNIGKRESHLAHGSQKS